MSKGATQRGGTYNVAVVGLSGTEQEKGSSGVGKSCLCNRFVRPLADQYRCDHISVFGQSDFASQTINNDHWLYWGETVKTEDAIDYTFRLVEHTEFVDDNTFFPFHKTDRYQKRCLVVRLVSAGKLVYVSKDQLGLENERPKIFLPEGRISIDGFIVVFDVSQTPGRTLDKQKEFVHELLVGIQKSKRPAVLTTTKNDKGNEFFVAEALRLNRSLKNTLPLVETSATLNVNVDAAFMMLAHLIDKGNSSGSSRHSGQVRRQPLSYADADLIRKQMHEGALRAFHKLLESELTEFTQSCKKRLVSLKERSANAAVYNHFIEIHGSKEASRLFNEQLNRLRDEYLRRRRLYYLDKLPGVFRVLLPDLALLENVAISWQAVQNVLRAHADFNLYFVDLPDDATWEEWECSAAVTDYSSSLLHRSDLIPFDLLSTDDSHQVYTNHVEWLRADSRRALLREELRFLLDNCRACLPGKVLRDLHPFLIGKSAFDCLSESDRLEVFTRQQADLLTRAQDQLTELLLERNDLFYHRQHRGSRLDPPPRHDLDGLHRALESEPRYNILDCLPEVRHRLILDHVAFVEKPSIRACPAPKSTCAEHQIARHINDYLRERGVHPAARRCHLLILGQPHLTASFVANAHSCCVNDEFTEGEAVFRISYCVESLPLSHIVPSEFHGVVLPYDSASTLTSLKSMVDSCFLRDLRLANHAKTRGGGGASEQQQVLLEQEKDDVYWDASADAATPLRHDDLPCVLVYCANSRDSFEDRSSLRRQGAELADRFGGTLIEERLTAPPTTPLAAGSICVESNVVVTRVLKYIVSNCAAFESAGSGSVSASGSTERRAGCSENIDLRLLMTFMCGDLYGLELPLAALTSRAPRVPTVARHRRLHFDWEDARRIQVVLSSYHQAWSIADSAEETPLHGALLVYWTARFASLCCARLMAQYLVGRGCPVVILAVNGAAPGRPNVNLEMGQRLAAELNSKSSVVAPGSPVRFLHVTSSSESLLHASTAFDDFVVYCLAQREATEAAFLQSSVHGQAVRLPSEEIAELPLHLPPAPPSSATICASATAVTSTAQYHRTTRARSFSESSADEGIYSEPYNALDPLLDSCSAASSAAKFTVSQQMRHMSLGDICDTLPKMELDMNENTSLSSTANQALRINDDSIEPIYALPLDQLQQQRLQSESKSSMLQKLLPRSMWKNGHARSHSDVESVGGLFPSTCSTSLGSEEILECEYSLPSDCLPLIGTSSPSQSVLPVQLPEEDSIYMEPAASRKNSNAVNVEMAAGRPLLERRPTPHSRRSPQRHWPNAEGDSQENTTDILHYHNSTENSIAFGNSNSGVGVASVLGFVRSSVDRRSNRENMKKEKKREKEERRKEKKERKEVKKSYSHRTSLSDGTLRPQRRSFDYNWSQHHSLLTTLADQPASTGSSNAAAAAKLLSNNRVPLFLVKCTQFVEQYGLESEGLYRVPGNKADEQLVLERFVDDHNVDFSTLSVPVAAVASALKCFLATMSDSLVPFSFGKRLAALSYLPREDQLMKLRELLRQLPEANRHTLLHLLMHFKRVHAAQQDNMNAMDASNLAIVWWPTLVRIDMASIKEVMTYQTPLCNIMEVLIRDCEQLFGDLSCSDVGSLSPSLPSSQRADDLHYHNHLEAGAIASSSSNLLE